MKKILLFGATGGTGKEVVKQALEKGYEVTVAIRDPSAFTVRHASLTVLKGDVLKPSTFERQIAGKDAVLSCLGTGSSLKPTTLYSEGIQNITAAMKAAGVKRLLCISAGALDVNKEMGFFIRCLTKVILQKILKELYTDMRLMETEVESSSLDWTVLRPAMLKNHPLTGKYRVGIHSHIRHPFSIARADLAQYMLNSISDAQTFQAKVEIAY